MRREVKSVRVVYRDGGQWEYAGSALNHAPPADRIALARELLAGTGKVVAVYVGHEKTAGTRAPKCMGPGDAAAWSCGAQYMRLAMLGDEG